MTNEHYLHVSYYAAAFVAVALAAATAAVLTAALKSAMAGPASRKLAVVLRRVFPAWLLLAVMLGFMSVSYFDCGHGTYASIVDDRPHLIGKTQEQGQAMLLYLAVGLTVYAFVLFLFLWARARRRQENSARSPKCQTR